VRDHLLKRGILDGLNLEARLAVYLCPSSQSLRPVRLGFVEDLGHLLG